MSRCLQEADQLRDVDADISGSEKAFIEMQRCHMVQLKLQAAASALESWTSMAAQVTHTS